MDACGCVSTYDKIKTAYKTRNAAKTALIECITRGRAERGIYECPLGGGWHLTSQPGGLVARATKVSRVACPPGKRVVRLTGHGNQ